jgi:hypothetical protein
MAATRKKSKTPVGWEWVLDILDEAHLPYLGLPVKWDEIEEKHSRWAYDPDKKERIDPWQSH